MFFKIFSPSRDTHHTRHCHRSESLLRIDLPPESGVGVCRVRQIPAACRKGGITLVTPPTRFNLYRAVVRGDSPSCAACKSSTPKDRRYF
jgi:hypothetical protein